MTLALQKCALVERDVAHLIFPDDVQTFAGDKRPPVRPTPEGRARRYRPLRLPRMSLKDARVADQKRRNVRSSIVGYGARETQWTDVIALAEMLLMHRVLTTFKAKGQIADHGIRLAAGVLGPFGNAGGELVYERVRSADPRVWRVVLQPHRHRARQAADHSSRLSIA